ncbi:putative methyltransferase B0361.6 [Olea europaea var. sylvestris]|uniref:putative methyltransferase B0361.6 n=1 Tax=Olea europaea var. sylvestris TaxID=158386 RepID=UPI000C1D5638|nr:putative methyltransferase B0361.6 [Olea europaea var. sylvestris]
MPPLNTVVPGSIILNILSCELATRLAGQIARAATIFQIDEVMVFDNKSKSKDDSTDMVENNLDEYGTGAAFLYFHG